MTATQPSMRSLSAALALAEEYGVPVFPCRPRAEIVNGKLREAKSPLTKHGFKDASTNLQCIDEWFKERPDALIGVPTGTGTKLLVVDIDPDAAEWYRENQTRLACARIHKTRRGHHLLYRMPDVPLGNETGNLPPGVDIRGVGGYVIWWPAHGLEAIGDLADLTEPPAWLMEMLKGPKKRRPLENPQRNGHAKYGHGFRHKALLRYASSLRHKGISGAPFEAALLAWNIETCDPPQDEAEVRRIARDYATKPEDPEDPEVAEARDAARGIKLPSLGDLSAMPAIEKAPLINELLFPGAWLVVGRPKIGKSWLILQLTLAVAEQGTFLGFNCTATDLEVLCIFGEDNDARIQSRLAALGVAKAPNNCHLINQERLSELAQRFADTLTFAQFLDIWLTEHPKIRLLVIDTETTVRQVWDGERVADATPRVTESDYKQTRTFDEMALRRGLVVLLVNHARKLTSGGEWTDIHELINRSNTALAGASGSIALADPPDADKFDPTQKTRVLGIRGRDLKEDLLLAVRQQPDMPYFTSDGPYAEVRQSELETELLQGLEELMPDTKPDEYVTTEELAACLGKNRGAVKKAVSRMLKKGHTRWKQSRVIVKRGKGGGLRLDPIEL
jgi:hypothetical protein